MTGNDMIDSFNQYYDKITNLAAPGYEDTEILLFLNNAQDEFIRNKVFGKDSQQLAFNISERQVADIRPIADRGLLDPTTSPGNPVIDNQFWFLLSGLEDFQYLISAQIGITRTAYPLISSSEVVQCKIVNTEQWDNFSGLTGVMNKTIIHKIPLLVDEETLKVYIDRFTTVIQLYVFFTKIPTTIAADNSTPDLETHTHQLIVDIAVRQALATSQDARYQTKVVEQQIKSA